MKKFSFRHDYKIDSNIRAKYNNAEAYAMHILLGRAIESLIKHYNLPKLKIGFWYGGGLGPTGLDDVISLHIEEE